MCLKWLTAHDVFDLARKLKLRWNKNAEWEMIDYFGALERGPYKMLNEK